MGKLLDRLTGTRHPKAGTPPRPLEQVYAALYALNRPDVPYLVRDGQPEGVDLVAELKIDDEHWTGLLREWGVSTQFQILMQLDPGRCEVRSTDEQRRFVWEAGGAVFGAHREFRRGQINSTRKVWTVTKDGLQHEPDLGYSSSAAKNVLRERVLSVGWTWRGVVFGGRP